jgi:hypothetical protein
MNLEHILIADKLERFGYLNQTRKLARISTAIVYWSTGENGLGSQIISNGTMSFVKLLGEIVGVTNHHVYLGFLKSKRLYKDLECQIGGVRMDLQEHLIDFNKKSDLATFKIPEILFNQSGRYCHSIPHWPASRVKKDEIVVCGGYPGNRRDEKPGQIVSDFVSFICKVTDVSEKHLSIQLELDKSYWTQGISLEQNPELGGMSGGPVYRYIDAPIERLGIVGFIYEFGFSDIIFASHADCIQSTGIINNSKII